MNGGIINLFFLTYGASFDLIKMINILIFKIIGEILKY